MRAKADKSNEEGVLHRKHLNRLREALRRSKQQSIRGLLGHGAMKFRSGQTGVRSNVDNEEPCIGDGASHLESKERNFDFNEKLVLLDSEKNRGVPV